SPDGFTLRAVYSTELYEEADVAALLARYEVLLLAVATNPEALVGQVPMFTPADRAVLDSVRIRVEDAFGQQVPPGVLGVEAGTAEPARLGRDGTVERPEPAEQPAPGATLPVSTEMITQLVAVWAETLGRDDVDADSNFFDLGGNSLLGAKLAQT